MRLRAATLLLSLGLLGCAGDGTGSASSRCEEAETAADEQAEIAQAAQADATRARQDMQRAEGVYYAAYREAGYPGTAELNLAVDKALRERNAADHAHKKAEATAQHEMRLVFQILVGESDCFSPKDVAKAREHLGR